MMASRILYILAALSLIVGFVDVQDARPGSHAQIEAGILFILTPIFAVSGFIASRVATKVCGACAERIAKGAIKCKHCGSDIPTLAAG